MKCFRVLLFVPALFAIVPALSRTADGCPPVALQTSAVANAHDVVVASQAVAIPHAVPVLVQTRIVQVEAAPVCAASQSVVVPRSLEVRSHLGTAFVRRRAVIQQRAVNRQRSAVLQRVRPARVRSFSIQRTVVR
jgi:hypothetical protein